MQAAAALAEVRERAPLAQTACPCCGEGGAEIIYRVPSVPIHSCVLLESPAAARAFPRRDLELAFCGACGFLFNHIYDEEVMGYSTNFEESQHFSETFSSFARKLAREIHEKCALAGKQVLEIGCGKGEFLIDLCTVSGATGLGIDPGYRADAGRSQAKNVQFIVDYYGPKYEDVPADLVLCRHTLEHIALPRKFINSIRDTIGAREDVWVVFETPDARRILGEGAFWDIYYEHCSYFSAGTHAHLFRRARFEVTDLALVYHGQYIVQYAKPAPCATEPHLAAEFDLVAMRTLAAAFPAHVRKAQEMWRDRIRSAAGDHYRIVLWGGGSKGVAFLTTLGLEDEIAAVVDVNPYKQGKFVPGSGHEVVAPTALASIRPDLVVVMNPVYVSEVRAKLQGLGLEPQIMAV